MHVLTLYVLFNACNSLYVLFNACNSLYVLFNACNSLYVLFNACNSLYVLFNACNSLDMLLVTSGGMSSRVGFRKPLSFVLERWQMEVRCGDKWPQGTHYSDL